MTRITPEPIDGALSNAIHRAQEGERVIVQEGGVDVAALVSLDDLALLTRIEELIDNRAADDSKQESGDDIPWEALKSELGL